MIKSVEMINWRAFDSAKISFLPGITFIMGANGTGKTSILEAIAFGLTGSASTVKDRARLLKDPGKNATVRLEFALNGDTYLVERSQSTRRAERATIIRVGDPSPLATNNAATTGIIEKITGVSSEFLTRMIYMAEGDVFRFLSDPPGEAIDSQIRSVLGLTQLDELQKAIGIASKGIRDEIEAIEAIFDQFTKIGISNDAELANRIGELDKKRSEILTALRDAQAAIDTDKKQNQELLRLKPLLGAAIQVLSSYPESEAILRDMPVIEYYSALEADEKENQSSIQEAANSLARLEGEQESSRQILVVLSPLADSDETVPCPVCTKPMTLDERVRAIADIEDRLKANSERILQLHDRISVEKKAQEDVEAQLRGLRELRNFLVHVSLGKIDQSARIDDLQRLVESEVNAISVRISDEQARLTSIEEEIKRLEDEKAEFSAIQTRLSLCEFFSIKEAQTGLVNLEVRSLSLRAAATAVMKTLASQRDENLALLYQQISELWGRFASKQNWQIQLDEKGMPTMTSADGRGFDLCQFSGGEKTALLVILHTIVARYFSSSDFLLIDEPLEHLDPVNRRSLLRYLAQAHRNDIFKQLIITTFEETLTRKYMAESGVNFIHMEDILHPA